MTISRALRARAARYARALRAGLDSSSQALQLGLPLEAKAEPTVVMLQLAARLLTNLSTTRTASKGCMCELGTKEAGGRTASIRHAAHMSEDCAHAARARARRTCGRRARCSSSAPRSTTTPSTWRMLTCAHARVVSECAMDTWAGMKLSGSKSTRAACRVCEPRRACYSSPGSRRPRIAAPVVAIVDSADDLLANTCVR